MNILYLLDTNAVSEMAKQMPDKAFMTKLTALEERCAISSTTWNELVYGMTILPAGNKRKMLASFLFNEIQGRFQIVHYDEHAALIHAELRSRLKEAETPIEYEDTEIASIAIANQLVLITNNTKHFEAISQIDSVFYYENWFE